MQIVDKSFFNDQNYLHIPLSVNDPSGSVTPSNATELDYLCEKLERDILLNAFGLSLYNEIKALTDTSIELPENAKYKKLIKGDEYNDKVWLGLSHSDSLIANYIYQEFVTQTDIRLSATGAKKVNPENATTQTPKYLISRASQNFIKQYQSEYLIYPNIIDNFTDWYGCDSIEKSLYGYLMDKKADFTNWKPEYFKVYESKNSFGI
jgi:hypothetical protein